MTIDRAPKWNLGVRAMHWLTLVLLVVAATLGFWANDLATGPVQLKLFASHKSVGLSILLLVLLRITWRFTSKAAPAAPGMSAASQRAASIGHGVLYLLLILLPLSGWWLTSVANFPFQWFEMFRVPMLVAPNADPAQQVLAEQLHELCFWVLSALVLGHVAMVIWHHRHGVALLPRLLPESRVSAVFFALGLLTLSAALVVWALGAADVFGNRAKAAPLTENNHSAQLESAAPLVELPAVDVPAQWQSLPRLSKLEFIGEYLGVAFVGHFAQFDVRLRFDPAHPADGVVYASVDVTSASTGSADMDAMLPDPVWFHFGQYPLARFHSERVLAIDASENDLQLIGVEPATASFRAEGALILKGRQRPLAISFSWHALPDGRARMRVVASVNRRDFAIGSGEWADDDSIGFNVQVRADVLLEQASVGAE